MNILEFLENLSYHGPMLRWVLNRVSVCFRSIYQTSLNFAGKLGELNSEVTRISVLWYHSLGFCFRHEKLILYAIIFSICQHQEGTRIQCDVSD